VAAFAAVGLETFRREWAEVVPWVSSFAVAVALVLLATHSHLISRRYFQMDPPRMQAAELIERHTPKGSLVIAATTNSDRTDDPRLLYRAGRYGWSVAVSSLDTTLVGRLRRAGATRLAVVLDREAPAGLAALEASYPDTGYALAARPWRLLLFDLGAARGR